MKNNLPWVEISSLRRENNDLNYIIVPFILKSNKKSEVRILCNCILITCDKKEHKHI
jgi:hypothetical protein